MGILMRGRVKGIFLLFLVGMFLVAGVFISRYLHAKAALNKPINQQKISGQNQLNKKNQWEKQALQISKAPNLENELIPKRQNEIHFWKQLNTLQVNSKLENNTSNETETTPQPSNTSPKTVYLTFDDGPERFSGEIIALLEQYHFKATFFMLNGNIKRYPESARLIVKMGEGVGLHGVTHNSKLFYASVSSVLGEMNQDHHTLKGITGIDSVLIRTPYGSVPDLTPQEKKALIDKGYKLWDWNIDSKDWYYKDERFVNNVIAQLHKRVNKKGPSVILMHERKETLAALPKLLDYLKKHHYQCKAIDGTMPPIHF